MRKTQAMVSQDMPQWLLSSRTTRMWSTSSTNLKKGHTGLQQVLCEVEEPPQK